jgi:hypothetical protein
MRKSAKTIKRLGLVAGAGTVAGLMPIAGLSAAYATQPAGPPTLALSSTLPAATAVTATNTFTATGAIAAGGTITINSLASGAAPGAVTAETLPAYAAAVPGTSPSNYVVTAGGTADPVTAVAPAVGAAAAAGDTETISLTNAIAAGTPVTVTITGVINATSASTVYFSDLTSGDTTPANTNTVNVTAATPTTSTVATVSSVNPTAVPVTATDFTLTGSNFYGTASTDTPVVYFIPTSVAAPATPTAAATTPGAGAATVTNVTTTQIEGTSPTTFEGTTPTANTSYNVVVYNVTEPAGTATYQGPSATSASSALYVSPGLNFVPENGVRVADSRVGLSLPNGAIASGTTVGFPVTALENSTTMPSNIPAGADAVALNVTAIAPASGGNLQVTNSNTCTTTTSTTPEIGTAAVNFQPGQDTSNTIVVPTTAAFLCIRDVGAPVQVTLDATGYTTSGFTSADATLLDTRPSSQSGTLLGPLAGGQVYSVGTGLVAGTEVALEVTAVAPTAPGNLRVFPETISGPPAASGVPDTAAVNYIPGTDSGSYFLTTVGYAGKIDIYSDSTGTVNVVLGEAGTFTGSSLVASTAPYRILDTRPTGIASGSSVTVTGSPSGSGSVFTPGNEVGVFGQLSDINPSAQGYETVYPAGAAVPNTASIANYPGQVRENTAFAPLNSSGQFSIASVGGTTNSTFDVSGYIS